MTQNPGGPPLPRTTTRPSMGVAGDDLDALLDSIMGDDPGPRQERAASIARESARQRLEQQRAEEQRTRQADLATDELRQQIAAIGTRLDSLDEVTTRQADQARALQELRQTLREMIAATDKQAKPQASIFNAELQLPSLQIKLVLAQAANLLHQADRDVTVLCAWSMLFTGVSLGTLLSTLFSISGPYTTRFWIYLAVSIFAFVVAIVFTWLTYQAHRRVVQAQRAMEESTVTRAVPIGS